MGSRLACAAALAAAWLGITPAAGALSLSLQSTGQTGSSLTVHVFIDGLGDGVPPTLRSYDLDVDFDETLLSLDLVSFDLGPAELVITDWAELPGGVVDVAAVSLVSTPDLDANQPPAFVLASLEFTVIGPGSADFAFTQIVLGDAFGSPLSPDTVTALQVSTVPEPGTALLLGLGLGAVASASRRPRPRLQRRRTG